jgi:hypothetical protein
MQDVLSLVNAIRVRSAELQDGLAAKHKVPPGEPPLGAFAMCNQYAVLTLELLSFYNQVWSALRAPEGPDLDRTRQENGERIISITKACFVLSLSAIEFSAKHAIVNIPGRVPPLAGRVYLRKIISATVNAGRISATDETVWDGCSEVRNTIVHNNGIAERDLAFALPSGTQVQLQRGLMMRGNLRLLPELTQWSVEAFGRWADGFLV